MDRNLALAYGIASIAVALAAAMFFSQNEPQTITKSEPVIIYVDEQGRALRKEDDVRLAEKSENREEREENSERENHERHEREEHKGWGDDD